jgi:hypothetical protein
VILATAGHAESDSRRPYPPYHPPHFHPHPPPLPQPNNCSEKEFPKGSYQRSCYACSLTNNTLSANCRTRISYYSYKNSDIDLGNCNMTKDIENLDGTLTCTEK